MRRLSDQVIVLEAIHEVRTQLKLVKDEGLVAQSEVVMRLATLYSLLDVSRLKDVVKKMDSRLESTNGRKAA